MNVNSKTTLSELLTNSDKADILGWLRDNLEDTEKCLVIIGKPNKDGSLGIESHQFGIPYQYELEGFLKMVYEMYHNCDEDEIQEAL